MLMTSDAVAVRDQVLTCKSARDISEMLLRPMAELVNAKTAAALVFSVARGGEIALNGSWAHGIPQHCHESYSSRFFRGDPMVQNHMRRLLSASATGLTSVFAVTGLSTICQQSNNSAYEDYYENFVREQGFEHLLVLSLSIPALLDRGVVIAFHRPSGWRPFDESAVAQIRALASAASTSLSILLLSGELERERLLRNALTSCLDHLGVAFLDDRRQLFFANENAARHWFGQDADSDVPSKILDILALPSRDRPHRVGALEVMLRDLHSDAGPLGWLVLSSRVITSAAVANRCFAFALTARETEVACLVAEGLGNPDIATALMISIRTVENHLRAIFVKMEVESRQRMMRVLLAHY